MSDERLRVFERRFVETGGKEDYIALMRERIRAGDVPSYELRRQALGCAVLLSFKDTIEGLIIEALKNPQASCLSETIVTSTKPYLINKTTAESVSDLEMFFCNCRAENKRDCTCLKETICITKSVKLNCISTFRDLDLKKDPALLGPMEGNTLLRDVFTDLLKFDDAKLTCHLLNLQYGPSFCSVYFKPIGKTWSLNFGRSSPGHGHKYLVKC